MSAATPPAAAADTIPSPSILSEEAGRAPAHDDHDQGNRVLYRDLRDFQRKRQRIVDEGAEHLQIISGISPGRSLFSVFLSIIDNSSCRLRRGALRRALSVFCSGNPSLRAFSQSYAKWCAAKLQHNDSSCVNNRVGLWLAVLL